MASLQALVGAALEAEGQAEVAQAVVASAGVVMAVVASVVVVTGVVALAGAAMVEPEGMVEASLEESTAELLEEEAKVAVARGVGALGVVGKAAAG